MTIDGLGEKVALMGAWMLGAHSAVLTQHDPARIHDPPRPNAEEHAAASAQPDRERIEACRATIHEIGHLIWPAADPEDFRDRIDAGLDDARLRDRALDATGVILAGRMEELHDFSAFAAGVIGGTSSDLLLSLVEGVSLSLQIAQLYQEPPAARADVTSLPVASFDLYSTALPVRVLNALLSSFRASTCFAALADVVLSKRHPPLWLAKLVARTWIEEQLHFLPFPAVSRGERVPEHVLPAHVRFDTHALVLEHNEGERIFEELMARAAPSRIARGS